MCDIILVNSPLFNEKQPINEDSLPPLGLGYIATNLQNRGIDIELIDAVYENLSVVELDSLIKRKKPRYVGINIFSTNYEIVQEFVINYDVRTHFIIGGPITKHVCNSIMEWPTGNHITVIIGEADYFLTDLIMGTVKELPLISVENRTVYKIDLLSPSFPYDISNIPLNRALFNHKPVLNHFGLYEAGIITSRGCIHNCAFCGAARERNKDSVVRERSAESIFNEIENLKNFYPDLHSIRVLDDLFLKDYSSIERAIKLFKAASMNWRAMAHVMSFKNVSLDTIKALKSSGCFELFIGIESGCSRIRELINKTGDIDAIKETVKKLLTVGINVKGYFIYGFPSEQLNDFRMTYELACQLKEMSMKTDGRFRVSVFEFRPYHGTQLFDMINNCEEKYKPIVQNRKLSVAIGREQFNFHSKNFSDATDEELNTYIIKTSEINKNF